MWTSSSHADAHQIAGKHYKSCPPEFQHWNLVAVHGWDYWQAQIIKYLMRWREKGGIEDLKKARHFLDKYIELAEAQDRAREDRSPEPDDGSQPTGAYVDQGRD